jgi:hypothetical protein
MAKCCTFNTDKWKCFNIAKYDGFCGIHRIDKPNLCQGITKCGKGCRRSVKRGQFCGFHLIPEEPDHDWVELSLYKPDVNWPNMKYVLRHVSKQKNGAQVNNLIEELNRDFNPSDRFYGIEIPIDPYRAEYRKNTLIIVKMQTFFVNYFVDYSSEHWQSMIKELAETTKNLKWLSEYRTLFCRKFDISFREKTKKNYIELVLTRSELGKDVAKKIINFMQ